MTVEAFLGEVASGLTASWLTCGASGKGQGALEEAGFFETIEEAVDNVIHKKKKCTQLSLETRTFLAGFSRRASMLCELSSLSECRSHWDNGVGFIAI